MRGEEKYRMILNAAKQVFAMEGFYNSKVSEIAREAHVADGTIYLYFKNKDDILISLFEEELTRIIKTVKTDLDTIRRSVPETDKILRQPSHHRRGRPGTGRGYTGGAQTIE